MWTRGFTEAAGCHTQTTKDRRARKRLGHTHSEPEESSSTVPVFMLMVIGVRPLSCSCRVCRGRGTPPPRLPSLPEEPCNDTIPERQLESLLWMRWMLLFSLMGGRYFFFKMPEGRRFRVKQKTHHSLLQSGNQGQRI